MTNNTDINSALVTFARHRFWWVHDEKSASKIMLLDRQSALLWEINPSTVKAFTKTEAVEHVKKLNIGGLNTWKVPGVEELKQFASSIENPLRRGHSDRLFNHYPWVTLLGRLDLDSFKIYPDTNAYCLACNACFLEKNTKPSDLSLLNKIHASNWYISSASMPSIEIKLKGLFTDTKNTDSTKSAPKPNAAAKTDIIESYKKIDYIAARLPELEPAQFTDPQKGLWELWGKEASYLEEKGIRARNPALDIKNWNVAIDFGTSSTVVAYDENDQHKLLRVGVNDYWKEEHPEHYENPTVLEFIDFAAFLKTWNSESYRPRLSWDQVRCSHDAQTHLRDNKGNADTVSSILTKMKHWALREANDPLRVRITDSKGVEHELAPLALRNSVRGIPLSVSNEDPFDPIELYAWFLGFNINWRGRGLFLKYYMTFPVDYPREVKDKILASFSRGLQRSLPETLVNQPDDFKRFSVEERASEPAAYAACAMPKLNLEPTTEGLAYGVFDFGGGTTDFDFGYYRWPTTEEEDEGKEEVFEHFGSAGDKFLGGENLLENLAYRTFRHNLKMCRDKKIAFTRPMDADDFAGSEMFLERTQAAFTNNILLMTALRSFWETGSTEFMNGGILKLKLLNNKGEQTACELSTPIDELNQYLEERIQQGVCNFLAALNKAFKNEIPDTLHILLAGNASRSPRVLKAFNSLSSAEANQEKKNYLQEYTANLFSKNKLELIIHEPLTADPENPYAPTAKTGVALGLLRLCPGSPVKVINRTLEASDDEAPFAYYIGRLRQGKFLAIIQQGSIYDEWHELGAPSEGVFNLYHSQSPRAHTGEMKQGESGLNKICLELSGNLKGQRVFARITGPSIIEVCTASNIEDAQSGIGDNVTVINLGK